MNEAELAPALRELLGKMKVGDISDVLRTPKGFQLLKLEARTGDTVMTAEEAHDQIADKLFEQKRRTELRKYLDRLRSQATIEWKNDELHKVYDAEVARQAAAAPVETPPPAAPTSAPAARGTAEQLSRRMAETSSARDPDAGSEHAAPQWYTIWTRGRHERKVHDEIRDRGIEVFLPTVARWSRWKDRKKQIEWPLFPGYCFARFSPPARLRIIACPGVVSDCVLQR